MLIHTRMAGIPVIGYSEMFRDLDMSTTNPVTQVQVFPLVHISVLGYIIHVCIQERLVRFTHHPLGLLCLPCLHREHSRPQNSPIFTAGSAGRRRPGDVGNV